MLARPLESDAFHSRRGKAARGIADQCRSTLPSVQAASNALANGIPAARLVVLRCVGYMSNMEDTEAFNSAVLSFLAGL